MRLKLFEEYNEYYEEISQFHIRDSYIIIGGWGSGDSSSFFGVSTKQPVGGPSEVSDLRYLEEEDDIEEVNDLKKKKKSEKNIK